MGVERDEDEEEEASVGAVADTPAAPEPANAEAEEVDVDIAENEGLINRRPPNDDEALPALAGLAEAADSTSCRIIVEKLRP